MSKCPWKSREREVTVEAETRVVQPQGTPAWSYQDLEEGHAPGGLERARPC